MAEDRIRYDLRAQHALRQVIREVLAEVAGNGLPGEHHFYITFDTNAPGVSLSDTIKARHAEEMTVVLQHQFWDLEVTADAFAVSLSFGNRPERLVVPFAAVKGFFDPSVQFGLQFDPQPRSGRPPVPVPAEAEGAPTATDAPPPGAAASDSAGAGAPQRGEAPAHAQDGAEVVSLDSFRKKH